MITHSVWIGPKLGLMEKLTLTLLVKHGNNPTLWVKGKVDGVPDGVKVEQLPKDIIAAHRLRRQSAPLHSERRDW
jgi:hypothetical protein